MRAGCEHALAYAAHPYRVGTSVYILTYSASIQRYTIDLSIYIRTWWRRGGGRRGPTAGGIGNAAWQSTPPGRFIFMHVSKSMYKVCVYVLVGSSESRLKS